MHLPHPIRSGIFKVAGRYQGEHRATPKGCLGLKKFPVKKIPGRGRGKIESYEPADALALATLSALPRLLLTAVLATLSGFLALLTRLRLSAAALLPALTTLLTALVLTALVLLARLLFIRIHNCSLRFLPWRQQTCPC